VAAFEGDPFFGGNWLVGGNINGDHVIDILDFGVYLTQLDWRGEADTPCGTPSPSADVNGDGLVDTLDLAFIQTYFGAADKNACCPGGTAATATPPILELSVAELESMGLSHLRTADLNGDGMLSTADITAYMRGQRDVKSPRLRNPPER
jgi:hypothetical protein